MKKILFLEDNAISRTCLAMTLEEEGYYVKNAKDGFLGLEIFNKEKFDLIITDLKMPVIDGKEVYSRVREIEKINNRKQVPFIILSGKEQPDFMNDKNVHFIMKPVDIDILLNKISLLLNEI